MKSNYKTDHRPHKAALNDLMSTIKYLNLVCEVECYSKN